MPQQRRLVLPSTVEKSPETKHDFASQLSRHAESPKIQGDSLLASRN